MKTWSILIAAVAAIGLGVSLGAGTADSATRKKNKQCMYTSPITGKSTTWKCKAAETCCWSVLEQKGMCKASKSCL